MVFLRKMFAGRGNSPKMNSRGLKVFFFKGLTLFSITPNRQLFFECFFPKEYFSNRLTVQIENFLKDLQLIFIWRTRSDIYPKRGLFKEFLFLKDFFLFEEKFCPRTHRYPKRGLFKNVFFSNDLYLIYKRKGFFQRTFWKNCFSKDFKVKFLKYFLRTSHAFRT